MTLYANNRGFIGEKNFFKQLILRGREMDLDVLIFTPSDVRHSTRKVYAHHFNNSTKKWERRMRPLPTLIFDRCRFQSTNRFKQLRQFRKRYPDLTYLNRPLANKWIIHNVLYKNKEIRPFLPFTLKYRSYSDVLDLIEKTSSVYLKPINGTGGRGILKITKNKNRFHIQGRNQNRSIINSKKVTKSGLISSCKAWEMNKPMILQKGIDIGLENGHVHDYRLLMQKNGNGLWEMTGCAGRLGAKHSITSNLHGGGKAISMNAMMRYWFKDKSQRISIQQSMKDLGFLVVHEMEHQYGKLCELALDIAVDRSGHPWLLEINPKPSREVFSKIDEPETYEKALRRPLEYAIYKSKISGKA